MAARGLKIVITVDTISKTGFEKDQLVPVAEPVSIDDRLEDLLLEASRDEEKLAEIVEFMRSEIDREATRRAADAIRILFLKLKGRTWCECLHRIVGGENESMSQLAKRIGTSRQNVSQVTRRLKGICKLRN